MIRDGVIGPLPYFPGNVFWIAGRLLRELAGCVDFEHELERLPAGPSDDVERQSPAHAWERFLPIFAVKRGYALLDARVRAATQP